MCMSILHHRMGPGALWAICKVLLQTCKLRHWPGCHQDWNLLHP